MSENLVKIRLKSGQLEIEYEGRESFLKNDLSFDLNTIENLLDKLDRSNSGESALRNKEVQIESTQSEEINYSMSTIASRLDAKSGPDLVVAAVVYLTLVEHKKNTSRSDIAEKMKEAQGYYTKNMVSNLTKTLLNLVKSKRLNETSKEKYELPANELKRVEEILRD